ncbi:MAG TPA: tyrosine-type recombinase/integrase [Streptosporangiaceae bacterium]|nr:tyrosine-type recombinase/integrase [Streptosporangiaceae bacterium]
MALAGVRSLGAPQRLVTPQDIEDFEQELIDQYALAAVGAGFADSTIHDDRAAVFEFARFLRRPVWEARPEDGDGFLANLRRRGQARSTMAGKATSIAAFFEFLIARYQGDIHALTGHVLIQPIDEFNKPSARITSGAARIPPRDEEIAVLFASWRDSLPRVRKFLPAARDYMAASLWRRVGLRINETVMLDMRDWHPELGDFGKLHVRFGKGARGRGPTTRLVPAINSVAPLMEWWLTDVRHQFGDDWADPDAPLLPSERRDKLTGWCTRTGAEAMRSGLVGAVEAWLPAWSGRVTPHVLRHYCASSLYQHGMDLKAVQELLGHQWLSTTTRYIHVHDDHIETAWAAANERIARQLSELGR